MVHFRDNIQDFGPIFKENHRFLPHIKIIFSEDVSIVAFNCISILKTGFQFFLAAKLIGAGFATIALSGVGIGVGYIFGTYILAIAKNLDNVALEAKLRQIAMLGFAVTEAIGLFALMIVFLILFGI